MTTSIVNVCEKLLSRNEKTLQLLLPYRDNVEVLFVYVNELRYKQGCKERLMWMYGDAATGYRVSVTYYAEDSARYPPEGGGVL